MNLTKEKRTSNNHELPLSEIKHQNSHKYQKHTLSNITLKTKIALIGNPNCGKTTLFNQLTGSSQYVGNWPGVTVERKEGRLKGSDTLIYIVDLPGIYSLSPYSQEEIITRNYIMEDKPDIIINIVDSTNLERNLYLTTQLMELDCKIVLALNMNDILLKKGKKIDIKKLEDKLKVPIVSISASKNRGIDNLIQKSISHLNENKILYKNIHIYTPEIERTISEIEKIISNTDTYISEHNTRFAAVKIFENDPLINLLFDNNNIYKKQINGIIRELPEEIQRDTEIVIADQRYKYICKLCSECITQTTESLSFSLSRKLDNILTGRFTAIPIFFTLIFSIFYISFGPIGSYLRYYSEYFIITHIGGVIGKFLSASGASIWAKSLVQKAVVGGVGSIISFLPQILLLFTLLSILEDSGYMSRAAFIMDKPLKKLGLSGKSFIPLLMGFGCSVPAVLGTRILENKRDRELTIFMIPFMSCSAKTPLYLLFASIFFPNHQSLVIISIYILGVLLSIFTAYMFRDSLFSGKPSSFVMELPEYKLPSLKNLWIHIWDRIKDFIGRAGTVILGATIIIWFLQSFDYNLTFVSDDSQSILSSMGNIIAPIFTICGFGDWRASVSLLSGLIAKESIVSTMSVLYGSSTTSLSDALKVAFPPFSALAFMVFVLLYTPCIAAISSIHKELGSAKLTAISLIYQFLIAFFASALVFQIGTLFTNFIR